MAKQRRIMKEFRINEIAGVDRPAQAGARAVIMKSLDNAFETVLKHLAKPKKGEKTGDYVSRFMSDDRAKAEFPTEEQRLAVAYSQANKAMKKPTADDESQEDPEEEATETPDEEAAEDAQEPDEQGKKPAKKAQFSADERKKLAESGEALPDGSYPIRNRADLGNAVAAFGRASNKGPVARHIARRAKALDAADLIPDNGDLASLIASKSHTENTMELEELMEVNKGLTERLAKAEQVASLSDAQRSHYSSLRGKDQDTFLAKSDAERGEIVAKAADSNPVVFTAADGTAFRKNDDPRLVAQAKRIDEQATVLKASTEANTVATYAKRAGAELQNMTGTEVMKVALLRAVDGISDETVRKGALEFIKAANTALSPVFKSIGTRSGTPAGTAFEKLDQLAKARAEADKIPYAKAYDRVLSTQEGKDLYAETNSR